MFSDSKTAVRDLAVCGMLLAVCVILSMCSVQWQLLTVSFTFLAVGVTGMLYGPQVTFIFGAAVDIIGYLVKPAGGYFPGFTLVCAISGLIYGLLLHTKKRQPGEQLPLWRVIAAKTLDSVICNIILNTTCLVIMYNKAYTAILPMRILKNFILLPFEIIALAFVLKCVDLSWNRVFGERKQPLRK